MGFCSWLKDKFTTGVKKLANGVKKLANFAGDVVKTTGGLICDYVYGKAKAVVTTCWHGVLGACSWLSDKWEKAKEMAENGLDWLIKQWEIFTGEEKAEEAKKMLRALTEHYNQYQRDYEVEIFKLSSDGKNYVNRINAFKRIVMEEQFPHMNQILQKIKYEQKIVEDYAKNAATGFTFEELRSEHKLIKIDFEKHFWINTGLAIISLGFWTRKQAQESMDAVIEEEMKVKDIIAKAEAELTRFRIINKALANTAKYLEEMAEIYSDMLRKADGVTGYMRLLAMQYAHSLDIINCKLEYLPKADQDLLKAIFDMTVILNKVTKMSITAESQGTEVESYEKEIVECREAFDKVA